MSDHGAGADGKTREERPPYSALLSQPAGHDIIVAAPPVDSSGGG